MGNGKILKALEKNIDIKETHFWRGYSNTPKGIRLSTTKTDCDKSICILATDKGVLPFNQPVYFTAGTEYDGVSAEEAKKLAEDGKICSFTTSDLYAEYYNFADDPDLESIFNYGYSVKSKKYIDQVMHNIGLDRIINFCDSSYNSQELYEDFDALSTYHIILLGETCVGKKNDLWIAQTSYQCEVDDIAIITMYFDKEPTTEDLRIAFCIRDYNLKPIEVFTCRECGKLVNWLEIEGDITKKYEYAKERYCGC